jgi:hypothetical protein
MTKDELAAAQEEAALHRAVAVVNEHLLARYGVSFALAEQQSGPVLHLMGAKALSTGWHDPGSGRVAHLTVHLRGSLLTHELVVPGAKP